MIHATLMSTRVDGWQAMHEIDADHAAEIAAAMTGGASVPPVLVAECANGDYVLDGHHRLAAAQMIDHDWDSTIPAWVITADDWDALIEDEFGGEIPSRLSDVDAHILCDGIVYER